MKIRAVIAALTLIPMPASLMAAQWELVIISHSRSLYFIDKETVKDQNSYYNNYIKIAWFKTENILDKNVSYRTQKLFYHFKCDTSEMKLMQYIQYGPDGNVTKSGSALPYEQFQVVAPETVGHAMLQSACYGK
jgi:hypothetical protein